MSVPTETIETELREEIASEKFGTGRTVEVCVPASTSNLGSGFDCCGLALQLYLSVKATVIGGGAERSEVRLENGNGKEARPRDDLIYRTMKYVVDREGANLPAVRLDVRADIPFASGLGSSGAAIVAGIALSSELCELNLTQEKILRYGTLLEGHADNVAAALLGGLVFNCIREDGEVIAARRSWPAEIKILAVTPNWSVQTKHARTILSEHVSRQDAVYNLQRVALFGAALETRDYDLFWEAMQDRLHQSRRAQLVPGLTKALTLPRVPGLLGLALSGSGPSIVALATDNFDEISDRVVACFQKHELESTVRVLEVDDEGLRVFVTPSFAVRQTVIQ